MVATEARELREAGDRKRLGKVFFHVLGDDPPLPRRQASPIRTLRVPQVTVVVHEFVRENDSERIAIVRAANALTFHERLDLEHRLPQD